MRAIIILSTLAVALLCAADAGAQTTTADSLRQAQRTHMSVHKEAGPSEARKQREGHYMLTLNVDPLTAGKVAEIQSDYKAGMKALEADQSLGLDARKARVKALMEEKNGRLESLLDAGQQSRIIPGGEPRPSRTAVKEKDRKN